MGESGIRRMEMFEQVIGNDKIKELLKNSIQTKKTSHSYLFIGTEGIGKKIIAHQFAKMILCLEDKEEENCKSCLEFDSSNHPDFFFIEPDGNSIKIEQIREMQKKVAEKPILSQNKVYLINDSDKMTTEAQNCLLKTLEEPPEFVTMILIGANENAFLSTIKSRCMVLHFEPIQNQLLKTYLKEHFDWKIENDSLLDTFQGSIGKAIEARDRQELYEKVETFIFNIEKKDKIELITLADSFYQAKEEIFEILEYMNVLFLRLAKQNYLYTDCIQIVENTKKRLQSNSNYDMCIDHLIFSICEKIKTS